MSVSIYDSARLTPPVNNLDSHQKTARVWQLFQPGDVHASEYFEWGYDADYPHLLYTRKDIEGSLDLEMKLGDLKRIKFPKLRPSGTFHELDARKLDPALVSYQGTQTDANTNLYNRILKHQARLKRRIDQTHLFNCIKALTTGSATFYYEDGTSATISFNYGSAGTTPAHIIRTALNGTTAPTAIWTHANAQPLKNIRTLATALRSTTGYTGPLDVLMGTAAFDAFENHSSVLNRLDNRRIVGNQLMDNENSEYKGRIDGYDVYEVTFNYLLNTTYTEAWDTNTIAVVPRTDPEGWFRTEYGAPFDFPSGSDQVKFNMAPYFSKSMKIDDPPAQKIIVESRPLPVIKNNLAVRVQTVIS